VIVLGIESSGNTGGVALVDAGPAGSRFLGDVRLNLAGSHTERLLPAAERLLRDTETDLSGIGGITVSLGPGSFTGLRAGLGLGKGWAYARGIDLVGVPTLDVLAAESEGGPWVLALSDARRGEVFWALYRRSRRGIDESRRTRLGVPEDMAIACRVAVGDGGGGVCVVAGGGGAVEGDWFRPALAALEAEGVRPASIEWISPEPRTLARLGAERLVSGVKDDPMHLEPLYVRLSDAEGKRRA